MPSLDGRVIAIAGAAGGLGPVVAHRLAEEGAILALTDRDQGKLDELAAELAIRRGPTRRPGRRPARRERGDRLGEGDHERFGKVDGLAHLVGGWKGGEPLATRSLDDYEFLHDLLVRTLIHTSRAFYEPLAASENGRFILISSTQAQGPDGTNASYGATKAAAEAWTLALADSFSKAESSATANIVVINAILTPQMREANPDKPYKTFTSAEDIADAIAYLCSDAAAKMNGARLELHP